MRKFLFEGKLRTYQELLLTEQWKRRRKEILEIDCYQCEICKSNKELNVHHTIYIENRLPWNYSDNQLMTLCANCHEREHEIIKAKKNNRLRQRNENGKFDCEPQQIRGLIAEVIKNGKKIY